MKLLIETPTWILTLSIILCLASIGYSLDGGALDNQQLSNQHRNFIEVYKDFEPSLKRAPSVGFYGVRGKKVPSGNNFFGMRGKKGPSGFLGMRGKKDSTPQGDIDNFLANVWNRPSFGFDSYEKYYGLGNGNGNGLGDESTLESVEKRAPVDGFLGVRGKRSLKNSNNNKNNNKL